MFSIEIVARTGTYDLPRNVLAGSCASAGVIESPGAAWGAYCDDCQYCTIARRAEIESADTRNRA